MNAAISIDQRKAEIKRIHVLRGMLRMGEDEYRDLISNLFDGKRSSTDLCDAERDRFLQHLQGLARRARREASNARPAAGKRAKRLTGKQLKMFSLWQQLADKGLVRDRRMSALRAYAARQTHVEQLEWLNSHQETTLIESLKRWLARGEEGPAHE